MLLIGFGVVLGAFGANRRFDDMDQRVLVSLGAFGQGGQIQLSHGVILAKWQSALWPRRTVRHRPAVQGHLVGCGPRDKARRAGYIC
ncbi:hypothetical protein D3C81_439430 [compost metagenome]